MVTIGLFIERPFYYYLWTTRFYNHTSTSIIDITRPSQGILSRDRIGQPLTTATATLTIRTTHYQTPPFSSRTILVHRPVPTSLA
jgi:hypothetical protein